MDIFSFVFFFLFSCRILKGLAYVCVCVCQNSHSMKVQVWERGISLPYIRFRVISHNKLYVLQLMPVKNIIGSYRYSQMGTQLHLLFVEKQLDLVVGVNFESRGGKIQHYVPQSPFHYFKLEIW